VNRLDQLAAPPIILINQRRLLQSAFEDLIAALAGKANSPWRAIEPMAFEPPSDETPNWAPEPEHGVAFLANTGLVVSHGDESWLIPRSRREPRRYWTPSLRLYATSDDGKYALFKHALFVGYHLLDLAQGQWMSGRVGDFPRGLMREEHEQAFIVDVPRDRERPAEAVADYPALNVSTPDNRFVWLEDKEGGGGIYECASGELVATLSFDAPPDLEEDLGEDAVTAIAFVLTPKDRFRFFAGRVVYDGTAVRFDLRRLLPAVSAVAFDRKGDKLVAIAGEEALVVALDRDEPEITERVALPLRS
jgi:hypothetical protein